MADRMGRGRWLGGDVLVPSSEVAPFLGHGYEERKNRWLARFRLTLPVGISRLTRCG